MRPSKPSFMQARDALAKLPSLVDVSIPDNKHLTVCGDTHGQFYDLCNIFELNGLPSDDNPYLFNGAHHGHARPPVWRPLTGPDLPFLFLAHQCRILTLLECRIAAERWRRAHWVAGLLWQEQLRGS